MSDLHPPSGDAPSEGPPVDPDVSALTPMDRVDVRDIDMHRVEQRPGSSDILQVNAPEGGTLVRGADGQWTWVPPQAPQPASIAPPWSAPSVPQVGTAVRITSITSHLPGGLLATLASLATVAVVGLAINAAVDDDPPGSVAPVAATSTQPNADNSISTDPSDDTGAAAANRIVTDIVKGCLSTSFLALMNLTFEAVPGADLDLTRNDPDRIYYIPPDQVAEQDLFTVTITATTGWPGTTGRWAVDISTGNYAPYTVQAGGPVRMYELFIAGGCPSHVLR